MCGITGIWHLNRQPVATTVAEKFNNSLRHRGPDGSGIFTDDAAGLALGHRRLSIIDLTEAGKQPMQSADGNLIITYNGEIFNYIELREELKAKGYHFHSRTDTEVILAAYQEWGKQCLLRFNGMWAFVIWDKKNKELFASRDRFGIKPFYYVHIPGKLFAFSSESVSFSELDGFQKRPNLKNISLTLQNQFYLEGQGETIYKDIYKLKPGHYLTFREGGRPEIARWWETSDHLMEVPRSYEEQVEQFRHLLVDACQLRLRSDVSIGTALSGGLDSSSVYCTIQQILKNDLFDKVNTPEEWQTAFIASFPGTTMDEKEYADEVIRYWNGKANYIYPDTSQIADAIVAETEAEDFIYLSPPVVHSIYGQMRKSGVTVSLDGHGVDEMLFGYPNMMQEWIEKDEAYANDHNLYQVWAGLTNNSMQQAKSISTNLLAGKRTSIQQLYDVLVPQVIKSTYRRYAFEKNKSRSWLQQFHQFNSQWDKVPFADDLAFAIPYKNFHITTLPTLLRNWDRASMRHGIEIRMPFMDWRLVTFVFSLGAASKAGGGYTKRILRDAMKGQMPESIRTRTYKIGINAPMVEWFNGPLSSFILDAVHSRSFVEAPVWNGPLLKEYAVDLTKDKKWTQHDCNLFWPYLNAWILFKDQF